MTPAVRKLALTAHVSTSIGWLGALAVFLAHAAAGYHSTDIDTVRAMSIAMGAAAWLVILPLAVASLVTGVVQALGTAWGLVRHYWVLFKLLLTVVATAVLLLKLGPISVLADAARQAGFGAGDHSGLRLSLLLHAGGGMLTLLAIAVLAIWKPVGVTPFGGLPGGDAPMPAWVKAFGFVVLLFTLAMVGMLLAGGHGPGMHA
jgi:hypothetical protein